MKKIKLGAIAMVGLALLGCAKESLEVEVQQSQMNSDGVPIKELQVDSSYDQDVKGVYQGVLVSAQGQERGHIWINVGSHGQYKAEVEMQDGKYYTYSVTKAKESHYHAEYEFESASNAQFTLNLEIPSEPEISNAFLNGQMFYGRVVKKTSKNNPISLTGTFHDFLNPNYKGTWNFIADGNSADPNGTGKGYFAVTEVIVTQNGNMYLDQGPFEGTTLGCQGEAIPVLGKIPLKSTVLITDQTSQFTPLSQTTWNVEVIANNLMGKSYYDSNCSNTFGGTFTNVWQGNTYNGVILID